MMPMTDDEDFIITVRDIDSLGDTNYASFYLTEKAYDSLKVGNYVCFSPDCMEKTDENVRETR